MLTAMVNRSDIGRKNVATGKRFERLWCTWLKQWKREGEPVVAERTRQYDGRLDADIDHNITLLDGVAVHFEVTGEQRCKVGSRQLEDKYCQASRDAPPGTEPMVAHRVPKSPTWLVTFKPWCPLPRGPIMTMGAAEWMTANGFQR